MCVFLFLGVQIKLVCTCTGLLCGDVCTCGHLLITFCFSCGVSWSIIIFSKLANMLSSSSAESAADFKSKSLPVGKENDHFVLPSLSSVARGSVSSMENLSNIHHFKTGSPTASIKMKDNGDSVPRVKRPYNKKRVPPPDEFAEKPPPKKRGRKSKKELMLLNKKSEITELINSPMVTNTKVTKSRKKPPPVGEDPLKLPVKPPRKNASASKSKKNQHSNMGPSVFDKKMLAGPHLTVY